MTDEVRQEAIALLRQLRAESQRFERRLGLAGVGDSSLDAFRLALKTLDRHGYYKEILPTEKAAWMAALDAAIAELEASDA